MTETPEPIDTRDEEPITNVEIADEAPAVDDDRYVSFDDEDTVVTDTDPGRP